MTTTLGYVCFTVGNVEETLTFFSESFGLARRFITPEADYGELETGSTTLAFVSNELAHDNLDAAGGFAEFNPQHAPSPGYVTLVTDDVAALVANAVDRGATTYVAPAEKPWGQTVAYVRDPNGLLIEIATPVANS